MSRSQSDRKHSRGLLQRSGLTTAVILGVVLGILGLVWAAHLRGRIHTLTTSRAAPEPAPPVRPGGQDIFHLDRLEHADAMSPEFTSLVVLPGFGMEVLQAMIQLPGHAETPLLLATPEADLAKSAGQPMAAPVSVLVENRESGRWSTPHEMVQNYPSRQYSSDILPDGSAATAQFPAPVAAGGPSFPVGMDVKIYTMISGRGIEVTVSAKNVSDTQKRVSIAWTPRFLAPASGLQSLSVLAPQVEGQTDRSMESVPPIRLGSAAVDRTFVPLKQSFLSIGPEVRLHNSTDGYTLRLTALTPSIRSLHLQASKNGGSVLLAYSTAGAAADDPGSVVEPGDTLQWRVRLEATSDSGYTPSLD